MPCLPFPLPTRIADFRLRLSSIMPGRLKTMPKSLNDALGSSQGAPNIPDGAAAQADASGESMASTERKPNADGTYAFQDKLPKLPIPDLESSCRKYLDALKPLQSAREQEDSKAAVEDFLQEDGPELQERLKKYATGKSSYIEEFCT